MTRRRVVGVVRQPAVIASEMACAVPHPSFVWSVDAEAARAGIR